MAWRFNGAGEPVCRQESAEKHRSVNWVDATARKSRKRHAIAAVRKAKFAKRHSKFAGVTIAAPAPPQRSLQEDSESPSRCIATGMVASSRDSRSSSGVRGQRVNANLIRVAPVANIQAASLGLGPAVPGASYRFQRVAA